ncbi:mechanosensitive ion channel protein 6-like [Impatiens glandulifera]|uniref:mechanosensitive ion channel protein 6-like n=1 Tax=Impatiens glandulifera TaxID=253017 RepID=UPI001FB144DB|nr:mechanosensitive ion channel protein 6-like [Impatiens glandulifera]
MDFSSSIKRSFKNHGGSNKHSRKMSDIIHDEQQLPILSDSSSSAAPPRPTMNQDVIVKVEGATDDNTNPGGRILRGSSYEFWKSGQKEDVPAAGGGGGSSSEDPPSRLIGQFLNKNKAVGGETSLDIDLEMDELRHDLAQNKTTTPITGSPINSFFRRGETESTMASPSRELRVSFQIPSNVTFDQKEPVEKIGKRQQKDEITNDDAADKSPPNQSPLVDSGRGGGEVLRCTSYQRRQSFMRTKTKSRLLDPQEPVELRSGRLIGKSGQLRSGILGRSSGMLAKPPEEEDDDPLFDDDIPDELKEMKIDALTIIEWLSLIIIVSALICSLSVNNLRRQMFRGLEVWKWELLIFVLICGRLVSGWAIRIAVFFIERNFLLRKRVLYFVYGVRKSVQNCIWLGLVTLTWHIFFDRKVASQRDNFLKYVNNIMLCMLFGSLVWMAKTLMVKVLASSFHVSTFFDRIQESLFNQYVIETLSGPPCIERQIMFEEDERLMAEIQKFQNAGAPLPPDLRAAAFPASCKSGMGGIPRPQPPQRIQSMKVSRAPSKRQVDKADKVDNSSAIPIEQLDKLNVKNISAWNMKRLMRIVRYGSLSTLDEQILGSSSLDEGKTQIQSEHEAKLAARKIFKNVTRPGSKFIYLENLLRFMAENEAVKTIVLMSGSPETEKISKSALKNWVVNAFVERRALALTLDDTKTAVNKLHRMLNVIVMIIILIVWLLILGIATSQFLVYVSSQIVVVAFIFGNTCKTVFEAIVFLFVMHPFDVGDRCEIDGVQMVVEEMDILSTVFLRYDNQKIVFPNATLATKPIGNYYRSPDMGDSIDFNIHMATPVEKISLMKQRILSFVESKKDHWYSTPAVVYMQMEELHRVKMSVWMRHKMNHQNMGERWLRRAVVLEEMVKIFRELDVEYRLLPIDINIRSMAPLTQPLISTNRIPSGWNTPPIGQAP